MLSYKTEKLLLLGIKICLYATLAAPLLLLAAYFFPAIFPKAIYIRLLIELALGLYLALALFAPKYRPRYQVFYLTLAIFAVIVFITSLAGVNFDYSFWGNYERMDGIFSWLHFWLLIVIASGVFRSKREWQKFFSASLGVAWLLVFYGFFQRWGVDHFIVKIYDTGAARLTSTIGNPGFFATYLLFHIAFAVNLLIDRSLKIGYKVFAAASLAALILAFLMTGTRGAVVGLSFGVLFYVVGYFVWLKREFLYQRKFWVRAAAVAAAMIMVFVFRHSPIISGNRLIGPYLNWSLSAPTVLTRLISWRGTLSGLSDNFWLGVGPQKFDVVFNNYFDPRFYTLVGSETWWDRAHNMALEVLITMGIIGLLAYLAIGLAVLYSLFKIGRTRPSEKREALLWMSFFWAYFIQNLFVFDSTTSYLMLALALAYVVARTAEAEINFTDRFSQAWQNWRQTKVFAHRRASLVILSAGLLAIAYVFYQFNVVLIKHNRMLLKVVSRQDYQPLHTTIANYRQILDLSDFDQREIAIKIGQLMGQFPYARATTNEDLQAGFNFALSVMEKTIAKNPNDVRLLLSYGNTANVYGDLLKKSDAKLAAFILTKSEAALKEAAEMGKTRQQVFYSLANTYLIAGDNLKGVAVLEQAAKIYEAAPITYWLLSFAYLQAGDKDNGILAADKAFAYGYHINDEREIHQLASLYIERNDYDRLLKLYEKAAVDVPTGAMQASLAALYAQLGKKAEALAAAQVVLQRDPSLREDVMKFIKDVEAGVKKNYFTE